MFLFLAENRKFKKMSKDYQYFTPDTVIKEYIHLQFVQPLRKSNNGTCGGCFFANAGRHSSKKSGKNAFYYGARGNSVSTLILIPNALHDMNV